jgi:hypothetical protein
MTYTHSFELGSDSDDILNLHALTVPVAYPKTAFHTYAGVVDLDDNSQRGVGLPSVVWNWTNIPQDQRDQLRTLIPDDSDPVLIRTRTNDNSAEYLYYTAQAIWPLLNEDYDAKTRNSFNLTFRQLVLKT